MWLVSLTSDARRHCRYQMRKVHTLNLTGRELVEVPDEIFMLAQEEGIPRVDLSKNALLEVPEG